MFRNFDHHLLLHVLVLVVLEGAVESLNYNATLLRDKILQSGLANYKNHERPKFVHEGMTGSGGGVNDATHVRVNMKILAITSVNVIDMEFTVDMLLRQQWIDLRLAWNRVDEFKNFTYEISVPSLRTELWLPDLFFRNGKSGYVHTMTVPNHLLRIKPDGKILYSQKITMRFSCPMKLSNFPMDTQYCSINIGSYAYTLDELKFIWNEEAAVELSEDIQISEFNPPNHAHTEDCTKTSSTTTGNYTCLIVTFRMQRQLGSYLAGTYVPAVLIVMVSWLSFWVSVEAVPARVTLGLLTLLGILTQGNTVMANLPRVSYIKAVDVWMSSCIIFVVGALIEFVLASMNLRKQSDDSWQEDIRLVVRMELARHGLFNEHNNRSGKSNSYKRKRCASESDQQNNNVIFLKENSPLKQPAREQPTVPKSAAQKELDTDHVLACSHQEPHETFLSMPRHANTISTAPIANRTPTHERVKTSKSTPIRWKTHDGSIHYPRTSAVKVQQTVTFGAATTGNRFSANQTATSQVSRETVAIFQQTDYTTTTTTTSHRAHSLSCTTVPKSSEVSKSLEPPVRETAILGSHEEMAQPSAPEGLVTTRTASIQLSRSLRPSLKVSSAVATGESLLGAATNAIPKPAGVVTDSEMDAYSRFLFPACFMLYNCFYWFYYLVLNRS